MSHILLVEDDMALREGLEEFLQLQGLTVKAVANGVDCFTAIANHNFTVAVIDLGLPDIAGQQIVEHMRRCSGTAIIVLTANESLDTRVDSYRNGADLFLGKPVDARELAAAVKSLAARRLTPALPVGTPTAVGVAGIWHLNAEQESLTSPGGLSVRFTTKEFELMALLAGSVGHTLQRDDACKSLYGRDDDAAHAALTTLVRRARRRISDSGIGDAPVRTAHGVGYRFAGTLHVQKMP